MVPGFGVSAEWQSIGPIVLPVWRCIMFNDSYLRTCMKLQIVQKIRFSHLESGRTKATGFAVSAECQSIGTSGKN